MWQTHTPFARGLARYQTLGIKPGWQYSTPLARHFLRADKQNHQKRIYWLNPLPWDEKDPLVDDLRQIMATLVTCHGQPPEMRLFRAVPQPWIYPLPDLVMPSRAGTCVKKVVELALTLLMASTHDLQTTLESAINDEIPRQKWDLLMIELVKTLYARHGTLQNRQGDIWFVPDRAA